MTERKVMLKVEYVCSNPEEFGEDARAYKEHQIEIENVTTTEECMIILFKYLGPATLNE